MGSAWSHVTATSRTAKACAIPVVLILVLLNWIAFALPLPVFNVIFLDTTGTLLPEVTSAQTRAALLGLAIAAYPVGQLLAAPLFGRLSDRFGHRTPLIASLWIAVIASGALLAGVIHDALALLYIGRFALGVASGNIAILQSIAAGLSTRETKPRNFAYIGISVDLGFVIGPALGGVIAGIAIAGLPPVAAPFVVAAFFYLANALVSFRVPAQAAAKLEHGQLRRSIRQTFFDPELQPLFVIAFLIHWAVMNFLYFSIFYVIQVFAVTTAQLGLIVALISVPLIASGLVVKSVVNRIGVRATCLTSTMLLITGTLWFLEGETLMSLVLPGIVVCIGINFAQTGTALLVSDAATAGEHGQAMGVHRSMVIGAGALCSALGGALSGYDPVLPFLAACVMAGLGTVAVARLRT